MTTLPTPDVYVGDIGFQIFIATGVNVEAATTKKIRYRKPDNTEGEWVASATSKNSLYGVEYVTTADTDIDQAGTWVLDVELSALPPGFTGTAGGDPPRVTMLVGRPLSGA